MNAAFLLVTSACLTGADPLPLLSPAPPLAVAAEDKAPADKALAAPVVAAAPIAGSCGGGCGCSQSHGFCESPGLFSRLKSSWSHHGCNTCDTCNTCAPAPVIVAAPCSTCDTCSKPSFFERFKSHSSCGTCSACGSPGLFGRFHSTGCGCDTCSTCGSATVVPAKPGEPLKAMPKEGEPKKLPEGSKEAAAPVVPDLTPASRTIELGTKSPF